MRRRSLIIIGVTLLAILLAFFISGQISAPEVGKTSGFEDGDMVSLTGELTCLQHQDQDGPQTMECAYGFKDETGIYYGINDTSSDYSLISSVPMNKTVVIEGTFRPSGDNKYIQSGTIEVTAINR